MARKKAETKGEGVAPAAPASSSGINADALRSLLSKSLGKEAVPDPLAMQNVEVYSTGLVALDLALGIGGYPRGRIVMIAGPQHGGKTALALAGIAQLQKEKPDAVCAIVDIEAAYSESLAVMLGVDVHPDRFIVIRPDTAENALAACLQLMGLDPDAKGRAWKRVRPSVDAIIYDSWAGSPTEEVGMAVLARVGSEWWPKVSLEVSRANVMFLLVNQIRLKPGVSFGNPEYDPGGEAVKHARSIFLKVHAVGDKQRNSQGEQIGHTVKIYVAKNKLARPFKTANAMLNYFSGFDQLADAYSVLEQKGVDLRETPGGNILTITYVPDEDSTPIVVRANGKDNFLDALREQPDAAEAFIKMAKDAPDATAQQV